MLECPIDMGVFVYTLNGKRVLLDVSSSLTFEIDEVVDKVLRLSSQLNNNEIIANLGEQYSIAEVVNAFEKLGMLKAAGLLSSRYVGGRELDLYDGQRKVLKQIEQNSEVLRDNLHKKYEKKVSVVIPAHNAENFIARTLDSVLASTISSKKKASSPAR